MNRWIASPNAMALIPGARLGPYEILGAIGAGGMGEAGETAVAKFKSR
jgi:hypothetical protein